MNYFFLLLLLLTAKAAAMLFLILYGGIGLGPDEAQYWTWSRILDWGYYSKPPGIAWEIWMGTHLFGNTELGVRSMALLIGTALPLAIYSLAKNCRLSPAACFWSAAAFALSPLGVLASFLAITDGGMLLFWTAACAYTAGKIEKKELPSYTVLGLWICCGALFKWPIYFLWLFIIYYSRMISWRILAGIAVSLAALLPSVYWNMTHEWATFRHVLATIEGGHAQPKGALMLSGNPLEFFASQIALVSPILFILMLIALLGLRQAARKGKGLLFCSSISIITLVAALTISCFTKIQGNWAIFAYPTAFVVLGWYAGEKRKYWLITALVLSVAMVTAVFAIPTIQSRGIFSQTPIPYRISPFRHNVGWQQLKGALREAGYDPKTDFLFADKYQIASILSFYSEGQKRAYFLNLQGIRKNQFSFWPGMEKEQLGKRGFFAVVENVKGSEMKILAERYEILLKPYFTHVRLIGIQPLFSAYGIPSKELLLFECSGYQGALPKDSTLY